MVTALFTEQIETSTAAGVPCVPRWIIDCSLSGHAADYAHATECAVLLDCSISCPETQSDNNCGQSDVILFWDGRLSSSVIRQLKQSPAFNRGGVQTCVIALHSLALHFGSRQAAEFQEALLRYLKSRVSRLILLRTGYVLSSHSSVVTLLRRFRCLERLIHPKLSSTFLTLTELSKIIDSELSVLPVRQRQQPNEENDSDGTVPAAATVRRLTVIGNRRSWRNTLRDHAGDVSRSLPERAVAGFTTLLAAAGFPWLLALIAIIVGRLIPAFRQIHFHTLNPGSAAELICLYNRHSHDTIQIAGYNNGVRHFGWKFPDKTIVQTTSIPGTMRVHNGRLRVGSGLTLKASVQELRRRDLEFHVLPNYSWISMGTLFFVPVHGSGNRVSTLGDTIDDVLLYHGQREQFVRAERTDPVFRDAMYDRNASWVLFRMRLRVRKRSSYSVRHFTVEQPTADQLLTLLRDPEPSHVELRKHRATDSAVHVSHFFTGDSLRTSEHELEHPRDHIGRLWDRLEETPVVSWLFHWAIRTFAFHVELLMTPDELSIFWENHRSLPLSKIQLRRVLQDGITHSACRDHDCIAADLFMMRRNQNAFCRFIATSLPDVRFNPGKQSL